MLLKEETKKEFNIEGVNEDLKEYLKAQYSLVSIGSDRDKRFWSLDNSENFTIKSYYEHIRPTNARNRAFSMTWYSFIPTKISFLCGEFSKEYCPPMRIHPSQ